MRPSALCRDAADTQSDLHIANEGNSAHSAHGASRAASAQRTPADNSASQLAGSLENATLFQQSSSLHDHAPPTTHLPAAAPKGLAAAVVPQGQSTSVAEFSEAPDARDQQSLLSDHANGANGGLKAAQEPAGAIEDIKAHSAIRPAARSPAHGEDAAGMQQVDGKLVEVSQDTDQSSLMATLIPLQTSFPDHHFRAI